MSTVPIERELDNVFCLVGIALWAFTYWLRSRVDLPAGTKTWIHWCLAICFVTSGVGADWYCAFEWFSGKYFFCSGPVLRGLGLIVVLYASITFLAVRVFGGKWRGAVAVFFAASYTLSGYMLIWWDVHR